MYYPSASKPLEGAKPKMDLYLGEGARVEVVNDGELPVRWQQGRRPSRRRVYVSPPPLSLSCSPNTAAPLFLPSPPSLPPVPSVRLCRRR